MDVGGFKRPTILNMLNVKYLLTKKAVKNPAFTKITGLEGIYQNLDYLPRAWFVNKIDNVKDQKAGYKRDAKGNLITSIPNEKVLKEIATAGKGTYFRFANSADSYREIALAIENMEKKTISTHEFSEYEDRYQIIALASLLCYFIGFIIPTKEKSKS